MGRMRLVDDGHRVTITYEDRETPYDDGGAEVERTFIAPADRLGYVRELRRDGSSTQPCEHLAGTGSTLMATRATLADVIRREYRAMRRAERAEREPPLLAPPAVAGRATRLGSLGCQSRRL